MQRNGMTGREGERDIGRQGELEGDESERERESLEKTNS